MRHRRPRRPLVVAIGVFDGVHRAHQQLIRTAVRLARRLRGESLVITFHPDPEAVLAPSRAQPSLMPIAARIAHLRSLGVDRVWVIPFTKRFARTSPQRFIRSVLIGRLRASAVVVGTAFAFGKDRRGDMALLRRAGPADGLRVVPVRQVTAGGQPISSSRIRRLIASGRLASAKRLLGRFPSLYGRVVRGAGRGRRLGFATANIALTSQVLPPQGVYVVLVRSFDARQRWRGVMNFGVRPTFGPGPLVCEVHLLGVTSARLLGRSVEVSLVARLRSERCFPSPQALSRQVRRDIARARRILSEVS
jgi:riboflavin kinase/FMN adenylyltransferase